MASKPKVYVTVPDLPASALDILKSDCEVEQWKECCAIPRKVLLDKIKGKDGVFVVSSIAVNKEFLDTAGNQLKVIATMSVGLDHIDLNKVKDRGIKLGFVAGVLEDTVAELAMSILLATTRRLFESHNAILNNEWKSWVPWNWLNGVGLNYSTVGIFGFGRIGLEIGRRLVGFKPKQILYTARSDKEYAKEICAKRVDFNTLLKECDVIIISCSLNEETNKLFSKEQFKQMKNTAVIVNISRGGVIDQDALIEALKNGSIGAAGLDVMTPEPLPPDHELLQLRNCVVIPHIGSAVWNTRRTMSELTAKNIVCALKNEKMPAEVL